MTDIPLELDRIIARCLKEDISRRWQHMADVKVALQDLRDDMEASHPDIPMARGTERGAIVFRKRWLALSALSLLLGGLALGAYSARRFLGSPPVTFQRLTFRRGDVTTARFGPGDAIVIVADWRKISAVAAQIPLSELAKLTRVSCAGKLKHSALALAGYLEKLLASLPPTDFEDEEWVSALQTRLQRCVEMGQNTKR